MKTKIILLIIAYKALSITTAFAQDKTQPPFYLRIYGGYSLFTPGSDILGGHAGDYGITSGSFTQSKQGAGAGLNYGLGLVVPINTLWMAGIDVNYLDGKKIKFHATEVYATNGITSNTNYNVDAYHSVWTITPSLSYKVIAQPGYFIYTKLGMVFAVKSKAAGNYSIDTQYQPAELGSLEQVDHSENKYGVDLGVQTAAGVQFKVARHISLFAELSGNFLTLRTKSAEGTFVLTGVDNKGTTVYKNNEHFIYNRSSRFSSGPTQNSSTVNGSTTTGDYTYTLPSPKEHVNSVVLNIGIAVGF